MLRVKLAHSLLRMENPCSVLLVLLLPALAAAPETCASRIDLEGWQANI
jgi:hypothetical protein